MVLILLILLNSGAHATDCPDQLGRSLPEYGQPKESRVDYKHLSQIMGFLRRAVIDGDPLPPNCKSELIEGGRRVRISGPNLMIEVGRENYELVIEVEAGALRKTLRANGDNYSKIFPYQPPRGRGALLSLHLGAMQSFR